MTLLLERRPCALSPPAMWETAFAIERTPAVPAPSQRNPMTKCQNEMRASGIRDVLIYCADYKCSNRIRVNTDQWSADVRLSDLENQFTCTVCGRRGADVRPDFNWDKKKSAGY